MNDLPEAVLQELVDDPEPAELDSSAGGSGASSDKGHDHQQKDALLGVEREVVDVESGGGAEGDRGEEGVLERLVVVGEAHPGGPAVEYDQQVDDHGYAEEPGEHGPELGVLAVHASLLPVDRTVVQVEVRGSEEHEQYCDELDRVRIGHHAVVCAHQSARRDGGAHETEGLERVHLAYEEKYQVYEAQEGVGVDERLGGVPHLHGVVRGSGTGELVHEDAASDTEKRQHVEEHDDDHDTSHPHGERPPDEEAHVL